MPNWTKFTSRNEALNALDDFHSTDLIFLDANIFLHHAFADPDHGETARHFLERVETAQIKALTSALVVNEVLFKMVLQEAAGHIPNPTAWIVRRFIRDDKSLRKIIYRPAKLYSDYIRALSEEGLILVDITIAQTQQAVEIGEKFGLLMTDATHIACCQNNSVLHIATDNQDLWHIPGMTAWVP
jgi:predicted nucleic acid-binding protein